MMDKMAGILTIVVSVGLFHLSLIYSSIFPSAVPYLILYSIVWCLLGIAYIVGFRWSLYGILVLDLPWILLFGIQFLRRTYYFVLYTGEVPGKPGSPLAFVIGWIFETPPTLMVFILTGYILIDLFKRSKKYKKGHPEYLNSLKEKIVFLLEELKFKLLAIDYLEIQKHNNDHEFELAFTHLIQKLSEDRVTLKKFHKQKIWELAEEIELENRLSSNNYFNL
jgi:hypothetical protein